MGTSRTDFDLVEALAFAKSEARRRARMLRWYVAVLLVPAALATYAIVSGRSEQRERAAARAREAQVRRGVDSVRVAVASVRPAVEQLDKLDTSVARALGDTAVRRFLRDAERLERDQRELAARLQTLGDQVEPIRSSVVRAGQRVDSVVATTSEILARIPKSPACPDTIRDPTRRLRVLGDWLREGTVEPEKTAQVWRRACS
jgi:hypothetical protein